MQKQYGITIKEALSLGIVNRLRLVGGQSGLERVIKLVNVIEVPDIMDWLMDGEFLLTTGYPFREYPELLTMLIPRMAERGSAGLAIKPKRYISEIPAELIKSADEHGIPLLEVPYDLSFSEIIAPILGVIFNKQNKVLQKLEQAHKKLMDIVLNGSHLENLCIETAKLISNPVAILDREEQLTVNPDCPDKDKFELLFTEGSPEIKQEKLRFGNIKEIKYSLEYAGGAESPPTIKAIRIPIVADKSEFGHMVALCNSPISDPDILILERAATIAAFDFTKRKAIFEIEKNYRTEFLEILLSCDFESEEEMIKRGRVFNIDLLKPTAVIMINDDSFNEMSGLPADINGPSTKESLLMAINKFQNLQDQCNLIAGIKGNNIVVVTEVGDGNPSDNLRKLCISLIRHLNETIKAKLNLKVGIGRSYNSIRKINRSFKEAREAMKICQLSETSNQAHFEELGFYKILSEKNKKELERFVEDLLQPVFEYDRAKNGELIITLETYYEVNRNLKLTSKKLFTHYNTILYRIKKIEELTGINLANPENALNMEIAVNILKLFRSEKT
ncbi:MAG: PucR family transcriptional regulator ligand-binding domain-containing protein [Bacillota bacterium]